MEADSLRSVLIEREEGAVCMETNKCATCKHWNPKKAGKWQSTDLRHAHWGRIRPKSPMHTCQRHIPASDAVSAARVLWLGKSCPHSKKLGSDQMNQVFPEIAVTADARQVGGHHYGKGRAAMGRNARMDDARAV